MHRFLPTKMSLNAQKEPNPYSAMYPPGGIQEHEVMFFCISFYSKLGIVAIYARRRKDGLVDRRFSS
jgi:hypothetical protein